ncbi:hypothetical protein NEHOM01_1998 [Nematocida homosporus]|uniref:uncharacterized protein n=1 Tax=Nematocida homosporus TaxID=1912981 RepID=UPI00221E6977|nr:uncharacterized protein NEHOM01_1998 [Nematocida homosporus]KAI5187193.1 hypothetical protein NEHOM01_1998 [Nematocida homosporus]
MRNMLIYRNMPCLLGMGILLWVLGLDVSCSQEIDNPPSTLSFSAHNHICWTLGHILSVSTFGDAILIGNIKPDIRCDIDMHNLVVGIVNDHVVLRQLDAQPPDILRDAECLLNTINVLCVTKLTIDHTTLYERSVIKIIARILVIIDCSRLIIENLTPTSNGAILCKLASAKLPVVATPTMKRNISICLRLGSSENYIGPRERHEHILKFILTAVQNKWVKCIRLESPCITNLRVLEIVNWCDSYILNLMTDSLADVHFIAKNQAQAYYLLLRRYSCTLMGNYWLENPKNQPPPGYLEQQRRSSFSLFLFLQANPGVYLALDLCTAILLLLICPSAIPFTYHVNSISIYGQKLGPRWLIEEIAHKILIHARSHYNKSIEGSMRSDANPRRTDARLYIPWLTAKQVIIMAELNRLIMPESDIEVKQDIIADIVPLFVQVTKIDLTLQCKPRSPSEDQLLKLLHHTDARILYIGCITNPILTLTDMTSITRLYSVNVIIAPKSLVRARIYWADFFQYIADLFIETVIVMINPKESCNNVCFCLETILHGILKSRCPSRRLLFIPDEKAPSEERSEELSEAPSLFHANRTSSNPILFDFVLNYLDIHNQPAWLIELVFGCLRFTNPNTCITITGLYEHGIDLAQLAKILPSLTKKVHHSSITLTLSHMDVFGCNFLDTIFRDYKGELAKLASKIVLTTKAQTPPLHLNVSLIYYSNILHQICAFSSTYPFVKQLQDNISKHIWISINIYGLINFDLIKTRVLLQPPIKLQALSIVGVVIDEPPYYNPGFRTFLGHVTIVSSKTQPSNISNATLQAISETKLYEWIDLSFGRPYPVIIPMKDIPHNSGRGMLVATQCPVQTALL